MYNYHLSYIFKPQWEKIPVGEVFKVGLNRRASVEILISLRAFVFFITEIRIAGSLEGILTKYGGTGK